MLQIRNELNAACAVADDSNPFSARVERRIPVRCMTQQAAVFGYPGIFRKPPCVEPANRCENKVKGIRGGGIRAEIVQRQSPDPSTSIPAGICDIVCKFGQPVDVVLPG